MRIAKAVITAASPKQRTLPLQCLIDRDGKEKSVLGILVEEALRAGVEDVGVVVAPGDEQAYARVVGDHAGRLHFIQQREPLGYAHAVYCAREFVGEDSFLHLVGDHIAVSTVEKGCAQQLVEIAETQDSSVSAVQPTRETLLMRYGTIGGQRVAGREGLYRIETVVEKPTPTEAEQRLVVSGLRAGHYLCFFGMHVLSSSVFRILEKLPGADGWRSVVFSHALVGLAAQEQYLALEIAGRRYDVGARYGLLTAQMALALSGSDRDTVLTELLELLAVRARGGAGK
ncbi:MAG: sugar phosphate nucleotidyltransferase [Bryobacteraceae bacterium]